MLESGILKVWFYFFDGIKFEYSVLEFDFKVYEWYFVGVEYNNLWDFNDQFDLLYVSEFVFNVIVYVFIFCNVGNILDIDISGCLCIGKNFNGDVVFYGYMLCFQFYEVLVYYLKDIFKDLFEKCDFNLWMMDCEFVYDFLIFIFIYVFIN